MMPRPQPPGQLARAAHPRSAWPAAMPRAVTRPTERSRMLAALCYSCPLIPSAIILWRERRDGFLRFHAAQALVFALLVALGQSLIYALLVVAGGAIHDLRLAVVAGVLFVALFAALGLAALLAWLRLVTACLDGQICVLPVAGGWAARIARRAPHR